MNDPLASIDAAAKAASVCKNNCDTNTTIAAIRRQANNAFPPPDATVTINARGAFALAWQFENAQAKLLEERIHSRRLVKLLDEANAELEKALQTIFEHGISTEN